MGESLHGDVISYFLTPEELEQEKKRLERPNPYPKKNQRKRNQVDWTWPLSRNKGEHS